MRNATKAAALVTLALPLAACASDGGGHSTGEDLGALAQPDPSLGIGPDPGPHGVPEDPPMLGPHRPRGATSGSAGNMTWHNGAILPDAVVAAIFWGAKWSDATFAADKISGLDSFYVGLDNSNYASSNTEYTGTNGQVVGTLVSYAGHIVDTSPAPRRAPRTTTVIAEVCKLITNPVANGYYAVYADTRRGGAGYCAWHSYASCNGVPVQFAWFFNLDGDSGCDPRDTSGSHSQGLAALANVSGHEYSEAVTDPRNGGWYDARGDENADKCAWTFDPLLLTFSNGSQWKIQGNWSNAAFTAGTGYPNSIGQKGCSSGL